MLTLYLNSLLISSNQNFFISRLKSYRQSLFSNCVACCSCSHCHSIPCMLPSRATPNLPQNISSYWAATAFNKSIWCARQTCFEFPGVWEDLEENRTPTLSKWRRTYVVGFAKASSKKISCEISPTSPNPWSCNFSRFLLILPPALIDYLRSERRWFKGDRSCLCSRSTLLLSLSWHQNYFIKVESTSQHCSSWARPPPAPIPSSTLPTTRMPQQRRFSTHQPNLQTKESVTNPYYFSGRNGTRPPVRKGHLTRLCGRWLGRVMVQMWNFIGCWRNRLRNSVAR